jgi:3-phenylpropionate/trans-cinnamate dioxygenase ferredoxin reductase subunit
VGAGTIVIVGASLAGLRAAEELRTLGFEGTITVVGDEPHRPYDRPPLSKQVLAGTKPPESTTLLTSRGTVEDLDLDWRLGESASGLDVAERSVLLAGGERLRYDGLVIATGASPKRLPGTDHIDGVHTLRTLDDCAAIRANLEASPRRVAVVGAGFIGAEVAATCRGLGIEVSMIEALPVPLERGLGGTMGSVVADLHRDHGVDVRLGVGVVLVEGGDRVGRIRLTDGAVVDVDLVVIGIGVTPNTAWLEGSGLTIDNGVLCDATCAAGPRVVAAGDVARWPNGRFGEVVRIEHWDNAIAMGIHAARTLVAAPGTAEPYRPVPWFWSDQYDRKIQLAGVAGPDDEVQVVSGSVAERRFVAFYGRAGRLVGVLGMSQPAKVMRWRALVEEGATWEHALSVASTAAADA